MLTYVVIHSALAPWRLPRRESGSSVKETRKGLRRLRDGVSDVSSKVAIKISDSKIEEYLIDSKHRARA